MNTRLYFRLRKLTPLWLDLSVKLKADHDADAAFGWVLEMWGYSLACARLGIKNFVWQQLQIEPSASWHQNVSAEEVRNKHTIKTIIEMWGYSLACARLGIKNFVWQQLQIEPSASWHQNVSAEEVRNNHQT